MSTEVSVRDTGAAGWSTVQSPLNQKKPYILIHHDSKAPRRGTPQ
jgi:hypothetical protein